MRVALGFDTSCYTTSVAAVDEHGEVLCSSRLLLPVTLGQRGLRQSEAVFVHVRQMPQVMSELATVLTAVNAEIIAVCASATPREAADSYMPVFTVGLGHAKVISDALHVPLFETSHQQGHIAAGCLYNPPMDEHFVALHLSGGTTELLDCDHGKLTLLGGSKDLHAGQMVDRIGVAMGLLFPAGPAFEQLALAFVGSAEAILPVSMENGDLDCHLSGAETRAQQLFAKAELSNERIAIEVFDLLSRTVARMLSAACKQTGATQALVVGGVASSTLLRQLLRARLKKQRSTLRITFGQPRFSADNAAGVAAIGMENYLHISPHQQRRQTL